jgi:hypothetical protein
VRNEQDFADEHAFFVWNDPSKSGSQPDDSTAATHLTFSDISGASAVVAVGDALLWWRYHVLCPAQLVSSGGPTQSKVSELEHVFKPALQIQVPVAEPFGSTGFGGESRSQFE